MNDIKTMNRAADNIRILAASMVEKAKSGHPGGAMGGADFINVVNGALLPLAILKLTWLVVLKIVAVLWGKVMPMQ